MPSFFKCLFSCVINKEAYGNLRVRFSTRFRGHARPPCNAIRTQPNKAADGRSSHGRPSRHTNSSGKERGSPSHPLEKKRAPPASVTPAVVDGEIVQGGLELGESSKDPTVAEDCYCGICMEEKYAFECIRMKGCAHAFCACCVGQYVAAKVEANEAWIGCPDPGCGVGFLEPEMCRFILPEKAIDRWGDRLCEEGILGTARFYCPYSDCSALLVRDGEEDEAVDVAVCPHCDRMLCARCRVPWHSRTTCKDYQAFVADEKGKGLLKLAKKKKWQRCPNCGFFVEKSEGAKQHFAINVQVKWMKALIDVVVVIFGDDPKPSTLIELIF
ncbi:hypothetical protein Cni_G28639 [Canna indica]|uniref:RBR-type E3 ubiquitin transferase n=1 Tax=Canna indica TaxID=4628 RepID=A0AAQ3L5V3_9LILI|nr:hypothetical protein Cni_G28639 [Canna indica]